MHADYTDQASAYADLLEAWKTLGPAGEGRARSFPTQWAPGDFPKLLEQLTDATVRRGQVEVRDPFLLANTEPLPDVRIPGHGGFDIRVSTRQPGIDAPGFASGFGVPFSDT